MNGVVHAWLHPEAVLGYKLPDPVNATVPYFVVFMMIEFLIATYQGKKIYNLRQTLSNLSAGVFLTFFSVFIKALFIFPYAWLHQQTAIIPDAPELSWVHQLLGFLIVDHSYYWFHRTAHMSNLGWAGHVTHHSSNDYNLSTALRQGIGESVYSWMYYLVLAPFAPLEVCALHKGVNTVIQFWVHTEVIPKLSPVVEGVMNTPSHHRVHHARNYGRANFGGVLIVWDRLYSSFEEEEDARPCIYGLDAARVPVGTYSPLWAQAHHLVATLRLAAGAPASAPSALFTRRYGPGMVVPAVVDAPAGSPLPPPGAGLDADPRRPNGWFPWERRALGVLDVYAALHLMGVLFPALLLLGQAAPGMSDGALAAAAAAGIVSLITSVGVMDGTPHALRWELARLAAVAAAAPSLAIAGVLGLAGLRALMALLAASALVILHQLAGLQAARAAPLAKKTA